MKDKKVEAILTPQCLYLMPKFYRHYILLYEYFMTIVRKKYFFIFAWNRIIAIIKRSYNNWEFPRGTLSYSVRYGWLRNENAKVYMLSVSASGPVQCIHRCCYGPGASHNWQNLLANTLGTRTTPYVDFIMSRWKNASSTAAYSEIVCAIFWFHN